MNKQSIMNKGMCHILFSSLIICATVLPVMANDYTVYTNKICDGLVPWQKAIEWIDAGDSFVPSGEERQQAISHLYLYRYWDRRIVPHLIRYSNSSDPNIRVATFWPLYANGERKRARQLFETEARNNNQLVRFIFYMPLQGGTNYKLELTKGDTDFIKMVNETATDTTISPLIRIHAAYHLMAVGDTAVSVAIAKDILVTTSELSARFESGGGHTPEEQIAGMAHKQAQWCIYFGTGADPYSDDVQILQSADSYLGIPSTDVIPRPEETKTVQATGSLPTYRDRNTWSAMQVAGVCLFLVSCILGVMFVKKLRGNKQGKRDT